MQREGGEKTLYPEEAILDQLSRQRKEDSCQEKERREGRRKTGRGRERPERAGQKRGECSQSPKLLLFFPSLCPVITLSWCQHVTTLLLTIKSSRGS